MWVAKLISIQNQVLKLWNKNDEQLTDILNFSSARTDQVLAEAEAYGLSTHQESDWDPELLTLNPDGLLKATAGQGATLRIEADASSQRI